MASINVRRRQRSTSIPRRHADGAADPHGARPPRLSRRRKRRISREQRRQMARKAGLSRRQLKRICGQLPRPVHAVFEPLAPALTRPTHRRLVLLALAALLTVGGRTIANLLRCLGALAWPVYTVNSYVIVSLNRGDPMGCGGRNILVREGLPTQAPSAPGAHPHPRWLPVPMPDWIDQELAALDLGDDRLHARQ